jgi:dihydroneopterin aldolase
MDDSPRDVILLQGIQVSAALGVTAAERSMRRPVMLDLEIARDLRRAGESDDLKDTIDYGDIYDVVARVAGERDHNLVEAMGERITSALFECFEIDSVELTVRKSRPIAGVLDWAGIRIVRRR